MPINGVPHPRAVRAVRDELIRLREGARDAEVTPGVAPKVGGVIDPFRLSINDPAIQPRISRIDEKGRPTFEWTPQGQYSIDLRRWQERPAAGNEAFHFTRNDIVRLIQKGGLYDGSYATTTRSLSPLQAQIDLALPPWRELPGAILRIDLEAMRARGYVIPKPTPVTRSFGMPGGGYEIHFPYPIPPEYITVIK